MGESLSLGEDERADLPDLDGPVPPRLAGGPVAMIPVAQLFRRDVPGLDGVVLGRGYSLWVFTCPVSAVHPHRTALQ